MKTKIILLLIFLTICLINVYGQKHCGSEMNIEEIQRTDPARYQRIMELENQIQSYKNNLRLKRTNTATIIIPVVVHVIYHDIDDIYENISDTRIYSQIQVLNEDFQRLNVDRDSTPDEFKSVAGNANIVFKLAKIDPNGNITNGN